MDNALNMDRNVSDEGTRVKFTSKKQFFALVYDNLKKLK